MKWGTGTTANHDRRCHTVNIVQRHPQMPFPRVKTLLSPSQTGWTTQRAHCIPVTQPRVQSSLWRQAQLEGITLNTLPKYKDHHSCQESSCLYWVVLFRVNASHCLELWTSPWGAAETEPIKGHTVRKPASLQASFWPWMPPLSDSEQWLLLKNYAGEKICTDAPELNMMKAEHFKPYLQLRNCLNWAWNSLLSL